MTTPNPYAPPPPPEAGSRAVGVADPRFSVSEVIADAWTLSHGCKGAFLLVYVAVFVGTFLLQALLGAVFGFAPESTMLAEILAQLVTAAVLYPLLAGVMRLALLRVDGHEIRAGDALAHGVSMLELALLGVLLTLATLIGFSLLLLPGVYLSVALMYALPLAVDRRLGAVAALTTSQRTVHPQWFRCAGLLLVLGIGLTLAAVTVIGLVWALPVTSLAVAVSYRRLFPAPVVLSPAGSDAA